PQRRPRGRGGHRQPAARGRHGLLAARAPAGGAAVAAAAGPAGPGDVRGSDRCTLRLRLTAGGAAARRLGLSGALARASARIASAGARTVALRPSAGMRRRLARAGTVRLIASAEATDAA